MKILIIVLIVIAVIIILWQTYELRQFDVTHYYINTPKVTKPHRICVVSDLHQHSYGRYNEDLINSIKNQEPDMIAIPGDMIVDKKPYQYGVASSFLSKISRMAPVYLSNGNHEKRVEDITNPNHVHYALYKEALLSFNVYTLNNTATRFDDEIEIYGLDLPVTYYTKGKRHNLSAFELMHMLGADIKPGAENKASDDEIPEDAIPAEEIAADETAISEVAHEVQDDVKDADPVKSAEDLEKEMKAEVADEKLEKMLNENSQMAALYSDLMRSKHDLALRRPRKKKKEVKHRSLLASMVYAEADKYESDRKKFELESRDMRVPSAKKQSRKTEATSCFPDDKKFRILLAHSPEFGNTYAEAGFDLSLCGHYHGGLVCLPDGKAVISPNFTLFPEFASGDNVVKGRHIITSRGLGTHTFNIRVFDRAELLVIHLLPEGANDAFRYKDPFDDIDFTAL